MEQERKKSFVERYFYLLFAVLVVVVVGVFVLSLRQGRDQVDSLRSELNKNYVEKIEVKQVGNSSGGYSDLFVIDGVSRYDCSEKDGRLTCSDDPQPTPEK